jgi:hypothetical protein
MQCLVVPVVCGTNYAKPCAHALPSMRAELGLEYLELQRCRVLSMYLLPADLCILHSSW